MTVKLKMKMNWDRAIIAGGILLLLVMLGQSLLVTRREAARNPTTAADSPSGLSVFYALKERLNPGGATSQRRALFKESDLASYEIYFLLSPKLPPTAREDKLLLDWVEGGGELIVAFHDEDTHERVKTYLARAGISAFVNEWSGFRNGETLKAESPREPAASPGRPQFLFPAPGKDSESYEFYSRLRFQDALCYQTSVDCYVREGRIGKGRVIAFAGIAPFANGLIGRSDNRKLAVRLALTGNSAAFDDYHLLMTEKTWADFVTDPSIILPMLGLLIGVLLYFFFGTGDYDEVGLRAPQARPRRSYHALNKQILRNVLGDSKSIQEAAERHLKFLERLLPRERERLQKIAAEMAKESAQQDASSSQVSSKFARRLVLFHYNWLKSRGRSS